MAQSPIRADPHIVAASRRERISVGVVPCEPIRLVVVAPAVGTPHVDAGVRPNPESTGAVETERESEIRFEPVLRGEMRYANPVSPRFDARDPQAVRIRGPN